MKDAREKGGKVEIKRRVKEEKVKYRDTNRG